MCARVVQRFFGYGMFSEDQENTNVNVFEKYLDLHSHRISAAPRSPDWSERRF